MTSEEFRAIRVQLGLTQSELAVLMGTYAQHISRIERGDRAPTRQQAAALILVEWLACSNGYNPWERFQKNTRRRVEK